MPPVMPGEVRVSGNRNHDWRGDNWRRDDWGGYDRRRGNRRIYGARSHCISGTHGDLNLGMGNVHQDVLSFDEIHVHRIRIQPRSRPWIDDTEPESAKLEARLTTNHDRMPDVELVSATEARVKTGGGNLAAAIEWVG